MWWIIFLIFSSSWIVSFLIIKRSDVNSDHVLNISCIRQIRYNGRRFISHRQDSLFNNEMVYPQLILWLLSYFSDYSLRRYSRYLTVIMKVCSSIIFLLFVDAMSPYLMMRYELIMIYGSFFYAYLPFTYNLSNAKNYGLSIRGVGLFLGELYLYCLLIYIQSPNVYLLAAAVLVGVIILLSSQFCIQVVFFSAPFLSLFYGKLVFLLIPICSLALFFVFFYNYAIRYFRLQVGHKKMYANFISKVNKQKFYSSIWKEAFYDIWVDGFKIIKARGSFIGWFKKLYSNPVTIVLTGFPFFVMVGVYSVFYTPPFSIYLLSQNLSLFILTFLVLFILTSFKNTRFLGEPQRYLEFVAGLIALLSIIAFYNAPGFLWLYISVSLLLTLMQLFWILYTNRYQPSLRKVEPLEAVAHKINSVSEEKGLADDEQRVLSNYLEVSRLLLDGKRKMFWGPAISSTVGRFKYEEVFSDFPYINEKFLPDLLREFKINFLIIDLSANTDIKRLEEHKNLRLETLGNFSDFRLLWVDSKEDSR